MDIASSVSEPQEVRDPALGVPNHWYIVGPLARLGASRQEVAVAGRTFEVWPDADGAFQASEDLPLLVADTYLWAFVGHRSPLGGPPRLENLERQGYVYQQRSVRMKVDYRVVLENSLDLPHSSFVHPMTQPSWFLHRLKGFPPLDATYEPTSDGLKVAGSLGRRVLFTQQFTLPDKMRLLVLPHSRHPVDLIVHHVPESRRSTRLEVLLGRKAMAWERTGVRYKPGAMLVHRQDQHIIEAQQLALDSGIVTPERHCEADAYTLLLRRVLAAAMAGEWRPADHEGPRTIRIRL